MNSHQAREILASFRAGTDDVQDPVFAEALALAGRDPTLAQWLERQQNADAALQAKFRATAVPADLPARILSGRRTSRPEPRQWLFTWIGLASAAAILVGAFGFWLLRHEPGNFASYRSQMAALVSDEYKMMLETKDQDAIRHYLAQNHAHSDYVSTPAMDRLTSEGCALIDWHHKRVALICYDLGGDSDLFLFVADRAVVPDAPTQVIPQFASVGLMATAAWTRGDKTYLLAVKETPSYCVSTSELRFAISSCHRCLIRGNSWLLIAYLQGKLADAAPTHVVVDCGGVGYSVFIPLSSYDKLPARGGEVKLLTYHHVNGQDGTQQLFGFATGEEREMFLLLISISGIGPKLACNILSSASITGLRGAIAAGDTKTLSALRGIGKKTAERLVVELKDKVGVGAKAETINDPRVSDAVLALVSLGYKQMDAYKAVLGVVEKLGAKASIEELVRAALRST